jgi:hypothetical protein
MAMVSSTGMLPQGIEPPGFVPGTVAVGQPQCQQLVSESAF